MYLILILSIVCFPLWCLCSRIVKVILFGSVWFFLCVFKSKINHIHFVVYNWILIKLIKHIKHQKHFYILAYTADILSILKEHLYLFCLRFNPGPCLFITRKRQQCTDKQAFGPILFIYRAQKWHYLKIHQKSFPIHFPIWHTRWQSNIII